MNDSAISIGVITLQQRTAGLTKLLKHLIPIAENHQGDIEIVIVNNSGQSAHSEISGTIDGSGIARVCPVNLVDSPENNIAVARNLLLDHSRHDLLAFLDDDEYPVVQWLDSLLHMMNTCDATVVAGPVPAVFHESAPSWVHTVDLHNTRGRENAQIIEHTGTGNVLINKTRIGGLRFDESFGKSGGSDTDFFIRVRENGGLIYWANDAIAYEDIPETRSSASYLIHRFIKQGENYRRISSERDNASSPLLFSSKAIAVVLISMPIAALMVLTKRPQAGDWVKRAFSNYGKLHSPKKQLYAS
ncbi:glycosyltransferase family 2 protein [Granulosicoccus sp. 3-233]|uniref:glycosyltransferase family 2 protein n=1 Tax=Granulosicoccus sp. 3-233 TaxID=3417969 RepID=UPI003D343151